MSSKRRTETQNFYKQNYFEAVHLITPKVYIEDDLSLSSVQNDPITDIINSHIAVARDVSSVLYIKPELTGIYSSIDKFSGIAQFFIKQNKLTEITPDSFEKEILLPLDLHFGSFDTSTEFSDYLTDTLLPGISLNSVGLGFATSDIINSLSWFYFLNTSPTSGYVHDSFVNKLYKGKNLYLVDAMKGLAEYLNTNAPTYIPSAFRQGTGQYTSGTQQLDKLKTWLEVIYSPLYTDISDYRVRDAFENYADSQVFESDTVGAGPLQRLLRAFSFGFYDFQDTTEVIKTFNDIDECPDNQLPLLAELIGWRLFGFDADRWRIQLKNAVDIYKKVGTKAAIQFAADTIFSKEVFNVETLITEMWESYVPYLIYYALATDSSYFKSNTTWTRELAENMGVSGYSFSSVDENLRLVTDSIILDIVRAYPTQFKFAGRAFPLGDHKFIFNYRGRNFPIPPFEEYPYYVNTEFTDEEINLIEDRLACFGVSQNFALAVGSYLRDNALNADDDIRLGNTWLLFTSGYNQPPNFDAIVKDLTNQRTEYLPLWSGKSSHFKLSFNAVDFDFAKDSLETDSKNALPIVADIVDKFSPAHAIPNLLLNLSANDTYSESDNKLFYLDYAMPDFGGLGCSISSTIANGETSGVYFGGYRRGSVSGSALSRGSLDSLINATWGSASSIPNLNRRSFRHRSLDNILPRAQWYTRTGFNMPVTLEVSTVSVNPNRFIPLGFIPSSLSFQTITDYNNIPAVYMRCQGLGSASSFYGYAVSNTYPCRGFGPLSSPDYYQDRGQLEPIIKVIFELGEASKLQLVSSIFYYNPSALHENEQWKNTVKSYINSATQNSNWFPNSISDFFNFKFGRDFQLLYKDYTSKFSRHKTHSNMVDLNGPNILAHTFGSIFRNSTLDLPGTVTGYIASSIDSAVDLVGHTGVFVTTGNGTTVANTTASMYVDSFEYRNANILSGIEIVHTSGILTGNSFTLYNLAKETRKSGQSPYLFDNAFIKMKSRDGLPRLRFDLRAYDNPLSEDHPFTKNFLVPDHGFNLNLNILTSNDLGQRGSGSKIGVWIHTSSENSMAWSFTPKGEWVQHASLISKEDLFNNYAHSFQLPDINLFVRQQTSSNNAYRFKCIDLVTSSNSPNVIFNFNENDFTNLSIKFNTCNTFVSLNDSYFRTYNQLHRMDQDYIIEIFKYPDIDTNKFVILNSINLVDETLNLRSQILVSGIPTNTNFGSRFCPEFRTPTTKDQLLTIIRYFNDIAGGGTKPGYASRNASISASSLETSGGSRLDYRILPEWTNPSYFTTSQFVQVATYRM